MYTSRENELNNYNRILERCLRFVKKNYFIEKFDVYKNDVKNTWKMIGSILGNTTKKCDFQWLHFD